MTPEEAARQLATKKRLLKRGWKSVEDSVSDVFYVRISHMRLGGHMASGPDYDEALSDALRFASHAQARHDAPKEK